MSGSGRRSPLLQNAMRENSKRSQVREIGELEFLRTAFRGKPENMSVIPLDIAYLRGLGKMGISCEER